MIEHAPGEAPGKHSDFPELADLPDEVIELLTAVERMRSRWAAADDATRTELWSGVHAAADAIWDRDPDRLAGPLAAVDLLVATTERRLQAKREAGRGYPLNYGPPRNEVGPMMAMSDRVGTVDNPLPGAHYRRTGPVPMDPPTEPTLALRHLGKVWLEVPSGETTPGRLHTLRFELSPDRMRSMHATLAMMLRMAGHEPDPSHPWFQGLAVDGDVYHELRHLCRQWRQTAVASWETSITARLAALIEQNEARLASHRAAVNDELRAAMPCGPPHPHGAQCRCITGHHPPPTPTTDPDEVP